MLREPPVLETPRLLLRAHRMSDFPALATMWADPEVVRFIGGQPSTSQQSWARLLSFAGHWQLLGYGYWAVEEKATGQYIGAFGFADLKRDLVPSIDGFPELGWALSTNVHRRGYASEGLQVIVAWGDRHLESSITVCLIDSSNAPSLRLAAKLGFGAPEEARYADQSILLLKRSRPS